LQCGGLLRGGRNKKKRKKKKTDKRYVSILKKEVV